MRTFKPTTIHSIDIFVDEDTLIRVNDYGLKIGEVGFASLDFLCIDTDLEGITNPTPVRKQIEFFTRCLAALQDHEQTRLQQEQVFNELQDLLSEREDLNNSVLARDYEEEAYNRNPENFDQLIDFPPCNNAREGFLVVNHRKEFLTFTITDDPIINPLPIDIDSLPSPTWEEFKGRWSIKCNSSSNRCRYNPVRGFPCSWHIWLEDKDKFCIFNGRLYWRIKLKRQLEGIKLPSTKRGRKSKSPISFTVQKGHHMKTKKVILSNKEIGTIRACMGIANAVLNTDISDSTWNQFQNELHRDNTDIPCLFCSGIRFLLEATDEDYFVSLANRLALTPDELDDIGE